MPIYLHTLRPPRNSLLRILLGVAGLAVLAFFSALAIALAGLVLLGFGLRRLWLSLQYPTATGARRQTPGSQSIIEGEYRVVRRESFEREPPSIHPH